MPEITTNPLLKPLKKLMAASAVFQSIPGFCSDSLNTAMNECRAAIKEEAQKAITKPKHKTK